MILLRICFLSLFLLLIWPNTSSAQKGQNHGQQKSAYLFYYFDGGDTTGLHIAYSLDGAEWKNLEQNAFYQALGTWKSFRDPSVVSAPDSTFHMVWTCSNNGFGYAFSADGQHWVNAKLVQVKGYDFANVWAPDLYYHDGLYHIIWSSTLKKDYVPPKDGAPWWTAQYDHRAYYVTTKDFLEFSQVKKFWNPEYNNIDATLIRDNGQFRIFYKDERESGKNIITGTSSQITGPYKNLKAVTASGAEGPIIFESDEGYKLYYDRYAANKGYVFKTSSDLKTFSREKELTKVDIDKIIRHGSIVRISREELNSLLSETQKLGLVKIFSNHNKEGLPASPFSTDTWPGLTFRKDK